MLLSMDLAALAIQKALLNQWQSAIEINKQILVDSPQCTEALNRLAQAYFQIGKLNKATKIYQTVLKIDKYNPIAKRKLEKIKIIRGNGDCLDHNDIYDNPDFIEEPGKTKVVALVRLGDRPTLATLKSCQKLKLIIRSKNICFYSNNQYVGRLPDDIARRLIWLVSRNNQYEAYCKAVEKNKVTIFIKEIKQSHKNRNYLSFTVSDK